MVSNFLHKDISNFAKIIDHNKPYAKRNIQLNLSCKNNKNNNSKHTSISKQESERIDEMIRIKHANKNYTAQSIITESINEHSLTSSFKSQSHNYSISKRLMNIEGQKLVKSFTRIEEKLLKNINCKIKSNQMKIIQFSVIYQQKKYAKE